MTNPRFEPGAAFDWSEHEEALEEFTEAAKWYERNRPDWGSVFIDAVDTAIRSIRDLGSAGASTEAQKAHRRSTRAASLAFPTTSSTS